MQDQKTFCVQVKVVNILGFVSYTVSIVTTQLCFWRVKAARDNIKTDVHLYPNKSLFTETAARFGHHTIVCQLLFKCMMIPPPSKCTLTSILKSIRFCE